MESQPKPTTSEAAGRQAVATAASSNPAGNGLNTSGKNTCTQLWCDRVLVQDIAWVARKIVFGAGPFIDGACQVTTDVKL
jgi:hypothetical protein